MEGERDCPEKKAQKKEHDFPTVCTGRSLSRFQALLGKAKTARTLPTESSTEQRRLPRNRSEESTFPAAQEKCPPAGGGQFQCCADKGSGALQAHLLRRAMWYALVSPHSVHQLASSCS